MSWREPKKGRHSLKRNQNKINMLTSKRNIFEKMREWMSPDTFFCAGKWTIFPKHFLFCTFVFPYFGRFAPLNFESQDMLTKKLCLEQALVISIKQMLRRHYDAHRDTLVILTYLREYEARWQSLSHWSLCTSLYLRAMWSQREACFFGSRQLMVAKMNGRAGAKKSAIVVSC